MTDQTNLEGKLRALLDQFQWEGFTRDELHHVSAAGVLKDLRDLLPDPPLPDPLFLAKATHPKCGEGIVGSRRPNVDGDVRFMFPDEAVDDGTNYQWVHPSTLTFHTPDTSDHPMFLETEEDYASAPEGTIVTLPANPHKHASFLGTEMRSDAPDRIKFAGPDGDWSNMIGLEADHIEPFALALLAHARRLA